MIFFKISKKILKKALFLIKNLDMLGNMVIFAAYHMYNFFFQTSPPVKVGLLFSTTVNRTDRSARIPTCTWKMYSASVSDTLQSSQVLRLPVVLTKLSSYGTLLRVVLPGYGLSWVAQKPFIALELCQEDLIKVRSKEKDLKNVVGSCEG